MKEESDVELGSEEETKKPARKRPAKRAKKEESGDETPKPKKRAPAKPKADPKPKKETEKQKEKKAKQKKEEEEAEPVFRWWEQQDQADNSVKWTTLEHSGVFFPPPYESLPTNVKMQYNGAFLFSILM